MTEIPHDLGAFDAISPGDDVAPMRLALAMGASVRTSTSPNPWVGAVVVAGNGEVVGTGATAPVGGSHAEVTALQQAGDAARGGTLYVTLEPCCHVGRTPPCTDAVIAAGVSRVVIGIVDPDEKVAGNGIAQLKSANIAVDLGVGSEEISEQLRPYIHHRKTARPFVLAKIAATLDGHTAAEDGSSQWITGEAARCDAHRLRAESDAIVVGAGTVRADNPSLTVRHVEGRDPLRVVLGSAPKEAKIHPCLEWSSSLDE
ncbi:MAG: bifunctional diaminohydroxyphosphoribosylaminopyrimidine deaminase/5-amino-6-(5-phosphoribosylamino)uracil reductase RibD, partial [Actinomycetota bacterium]|nr:bifunctional diaminohydroxyphosphoribosylaminopyrimidine deaminase/5-amino-6-(5-phosphoribosylamino)uracil reductase RibD [Actinomycetota bacterium]